MLALETGANKKLLATAQELCRFGDRFERVKGIGKTAPVRDSRHELRGALRPPRSAYSRGIKPALLPDQPDEEIARQIVLRCRRLKRAADSRGRYRLASGGFRRADLVRFRCTRVLCEADSTRNWSEKFGL